MEKTFYLEPMCVQLEPFQITPQSWYNFSTYKCTGYWQIYSAVLLRGIKRSLTISRKTVKLGNKVLLQEKIKYDTFHDLNLHFEILSFEYLLSITEATYLRKILSNRSAVFLKLVVPRRQIQIT